MALLLLLLPGALAATPAARADGGFVARVTMAHLPDGEPAIPEPEQHGVLLYREGVEDLYLDVRYAGNPAEFAWLVPCPTRPEASVQDAAGIHEVYRVAHAGGPRVEVGRIELVGSRGVPARPGAPNASIWDLAILPPERGAVRQWIRDHGLSPSVHARGVLDSYVRKGWYFVGMSIGAEARDARTADLLHEGRIQPLHLRFPAREPVFPLRISSINPGFSDIDLYVYSDQGVRARMASGVKWESWTFGRSMPPAALDPTGAWHSAGRAAPFLTRLRARFNAWEMQDDVYFAAYDPGKDLRANDRWRRMMAMHWIRETRATRWESTLRARLDRPDLDRAERRELRGAVTALTPSLANPPATAASTADSPGAHPTDAWVSLENRYPFRPAGRLWEPNSPPRPPPPEGSASTAGLPGTQ